MKKILDKDRLFVVFACLAVIALFLVPTGFPTSDYPGSETVKAEIVAVDNSGVYNSARIVLQGTQMCTVRILQGAFKGQEAQAANMFIGKLEIDKVFLEGDKALAVVDFDGDRITNVTLVDHYRIETEAILFGAFALFLILFGKSTGAKALLSFILTISAIWKIAVPALLKGYNPLVVTFFLVVTLTIMTIGLVTGLTKTSLVAILGSLSGTALTCVLAIVMGNKFRIHGAVMPWSESLLYAGYAHLQLTDIFIAGIFMASAGAVMDLAVDISAAMRELVEHNPLIDRMTLTRSGFEVGRAIIGTQTTTLLLAYSGGYMALLMVFMAQGTSVLNIMNLRYVSAEIVHTLVGSFGLVTVAPLTALIGGVIYPQKAANVVQTQEKDETSPARETSVPAQLGQS